MQNLSPILTEQYLEKADHFLQGMRRLSDNSGAYRSGVGLLAVHSAISLNDAIIAGVRGSRTKAEDHSTAVSELGRICAEFRVEANPGVQHFSYLVSRKTGIAYGNERISDADLKLTTDKAERFANLAYTHFKEVLGVRRS